MSKLSKQIKEHISCPELNGKPLGRWKVLNSQQKVNIWNLAEQCEFFEEIADKSMKELAKYKDDNEKLIGCIESLEARLRYLLTSKTICKYDNVHPNTKNYIKDIDELDKRIERLEKLENAIKLCGAVIHIGNNIDFGGKEYWVNGRERLYHITKEEHDLLKEVFDNE